MVLGDRFPTAAKRDHIRQSLQPGAVVYLHCPFTNPPKPKYLVVASIRPRLLLFIVNSEIPAYVQKRAHLRCCEVLLDEATHEFLEHDSYVDCQQAIKEFSLDTVESILMSELKRLVGRISADVQAQILAAVKACVVLPERDKGWIIPALS